MTSTFEIDAKAAQDLGFLPDRLGDAARFALAHDSPMNRDIRQALADGHFGEPWPIGQTIGPVADRGDPSGIVMRRGRPVLSWGDLDRVDMTFSISKSYIALCAGIAWDDGLIPDLDAPVREFVADGGFDSPQNRSITWRHLLQLTSEWEGTLWGKPDWIDHNRDVSGRPGANDRKGQKRTLFAPGTHWEYNDVRVNQAAYALTRVFRRSLPKVLKARIMDPIGASDHWAWHGYDTSWIEIDDRPVQSVSGGGHWGGGLWISTRDHALVGQLILQKGRWQGRQLLSEAWVDICATPCVLNPNYGLMWWLNTDGHAMYTAASAQSLFAIGVGTNLIWIDPARDLVVVLRWIAPDAVSGMLDHIVAAITS